MQSITNGIYYENAFAGVTLGAIIQPSGTLVIDTPLRAEESRSWKSVLLTQSRGTHRLLVNLDEHPDRTIGNRSMDITILAHQNTAETFDLRGTVFKGGNYENGEEWEKHPETIGSRWTPPKITFSDKIQLHWGESSIVIEHHPGPSAGAIWVEVPSEEVVFVGDAVVEDQPPFLANADIPSWLETLNLLRARKYRDYTIISGRSGPIEVDAVRSQHTLLKYIHQRIEKLASRNAPIEEFEKMTSSILAKLNFPAIHNTFYTHRLQHGLRQYYTHHFRPTDLQFEN
jgi:glyoxylase-like metal-dependent hydrolase (beta-lactamase superfamily II)